MTAVTRQAEDNRNAAVLHVAFELSEKTWKLAFTTGLGQKARIRNVGARDLEAVAREIELALRRFKLPAGTRIASCYEAGMDGFWLHRALLGRAIENQVVDSASIDVKRRRRAKTDRLDAAALVAKLVQYVAGDGKVWSVVRVPPAEVEDLRHNDRELHGLRSERTAVYNAIRGLLKTQGIRLGSLRKFDEQLAELVALEGGQLGAELKARLQRLWRRAQLIQEQIGEVESRREQLLKMDHQTARKAEQLQSLKTVGTTIAWTLSTEIFGWRQFSNRREVAGLVGVVPVADQSGSVHREHSSKQGRAHLRAILTELSWMWIRYQPESRITKWFEEKYAKGGKRQRRIGIVAVSRKLLIALWRFVETGALPEGALTKA